MAPKDWYKAYLTNPAEVEIEGLESFEKQTYRNRCLIGGTKDGCSEGIRLTVPVKKVEHKQLTRDIEISYQTRWQHQHWISLVSAYGQTPFFDYYAEFFKPFYEKETKWLWDLNNGLHEVICSLLSNERPSDFSRQPSAFSYRPTSDWSGKELNSWYGTGKSILDTLFEYGNETKDKLE